MYPCLSKEISPRSGLNILGITTIDSPRSGLTMLVIPRDKGRVAAHISRGITCIVRPRSGLLVPASSIVMRPRSGLLAVIITGITGR